MSIALATRGLYGPVGGSSVGLATRGLFEVNAGTVPLIPNAGGLLIATIHHLPLALGNYDLVRTSPRAELVTSTQVIVPTTHKKDSLT